jgi:hypothetical protein
VRETVVEALPGYGDQRVYLARTPIVAVASVTSGGVAVTDYTLESRDEGALWRRQGWAATAAAAAGISRWPRYGGVSLPGTEEEAFTVTYTGGYVPPGLARVNASMSVASEDNSFNDAANGFPPGLVAGDLLLSTGFAAEANNGRFVVVSATAGKIIVDAVLATEAAAAGRYVRFPGHKDVRSIESVERACLEAVKTWWLDREENDRVVERQVGNTRVRREDPYGVGAEPLALPPTSTALLQRWVRHA